jgi:hypothetical protein
LRAFKGQRAIAAERGAHALEHVAPAPARQVELGLVAAAVGARSLGYRKRLVGRPERLRARLLRPGQGVGMIGTRHPWLVGQRTGTDVAIEASDITLERGDLRAAAEAIRLSRRTSRTIKGTLFWAFAYNVAALPLAAAGLLNPMLAGAAMAFSSVFVVSNSLRLRRFRPQSDSPPQPGKAQWIVVGQCR